MLGPIDLKLSGIIPLVWMKKEHQIVIETKTENNLENKLKILKSIKVDEKHMILYLKIF